MRCRHKCENSRLGKKPPPWSERRALGKPDVFLELLQRRAWSSVSPTKTPLPFVGGGNKASLLLNLTEFYLNSFLALQPEQQRCPVSLRLFVMSRGRMGCFGCSRGSAWLLLLANEKEKSVAVVPSCPIQPPAPIYAP